MILPQSNGKTVLVSGINGYIASSIGLELLKNGYTLRGIARSKKSMKTLLRDAYKDYADRFEMMEVPDITVPAYVFNDLPSSYLIDMKLGVSSVIHTTSPISFALKTWDDFSPRREWLHQYTNLRSELRWSTARVLRADVLPCNISDPLKTAPYTFTEADWNNVAESKAKELSDSAPATVLYPVSKVAAERAVWQFKDEHKVRLQHPPIFRARLLTFQPQPPFANAAIHPTVVTGPPVQLVSIPRNLHVSLAPIWAIFSGTATSIPPAIGFSSYIDVRDIAAIHLWCVEHPSQAANQRYIVANGRGTPQAVADILRKAYPNRKIIPIGEPASDYVEGYGYPKDGVRFDSTKVSKALRRPMIGFEESILDTAKVFERYL
ncbi:MAG: hypothetical protein M1830_000349 [Pleopsidium flavum]|nr:MAG: hypothetical protein M1830_000349 [Pleopsidium flavum]